MTVLKGYREFFDRTDDPALCASKEKDGMFFIFRSIEAWKEENVKKKISRQRNSYVKNTKKQVPWPSIMFFTVSYIY